MNANSPEWEFMERVGHWMQEGPPWYLPDIAAFQKLRDLAVAAMEVVDADRGITPDLTAMDRNALRADMATKRDLYRATALAARIVRGKRRA